MKLRRWVGGMLSVAIGYAVWGVCATIAQTPGTADPMQVLGGGKPSGVSEEAYSDFMANEVLDVQDLVEGAELQRRLFNTITPPGFSLFQPMFPTVAPFDAEYFAESFLDGLLGEDRNSVAVYPLSLVLDPVTRETIVYNAKGAVIAVVRAGNVWQEGPEGIDPSRVELRLELLPKEDVAQYLYTEWRVSETLAAARTKTPKAGGHARRSLGAGQFGFADVEPLTNGNFRLTVTNGGDAAEIYSYTVRHMSSWEVVTWTNEESNVVTTTNTIWTPVSPSYAGQGSAWECRTTNLVLTDGVGVWDDANVASNARIRFYAVANPGDADEDSLSDGAEILVYHTLPDNIDTDDDGLSDGEEINDYGTNPLLPDTDNDGLYDGEEICEHGTDPLMADTDTDGLSDAEEVNVTDPLVVDTDHDGWRDGLDPDPKSRAWVDWGNPGLWTNGTACISNRYWPAWCRYAMTSGGSNDYAASSYNTASNAPTWQGCVWIVVNTNMIHGTNMAFWTYVSTNHVGLLYFQLRDTAWNNLVNNFLGTPYNPQYPTVINTATLGASGGEILLKVPMSNAPSAANIIHQRLTNAIAIYDSMLYVDADGDGLDDTQVAAITANPTNDYDEDGMADFWEHTWGLDFTRGDQNGNSALDGEDDFDDDGLTNAQEAGTETDPQSADTDGDGIPDGEEVNVYGTNPLVEDSDGDGLADGTEVYETQTDPLDSDCDDDGLNDGEENDNVTDPHDWDTDDDNLSDGDEVHVYEADPFDTDTDRDGMPDGWEAQNGFAPASGPHDYFDWFRFDEGTGLAVCERYNNFTGMVLNAGATNWIPGHTGVSNDYAVRFDGSNYVSVWTNRWKGPVVTQAPFSVSAWVRLDGVTSSTYATLFSCSSWVSNHFTGYLFRRAGAGTQSFYMGGATNHGFCDVSLPTDRWTHLVGVYDGTNMHMYTNGGHVAGGICREFQPVGTNLLFGRGHVNAAESSWRGAIDDVRFYYSTLSTQDVASLYEAYADADADGLSNLEEYRAETDPWDEDTDGDGQSDWREISLGTDPLDNADYFGIVINAVLPIPPPPGSEVGREWVELFNVGLGTKSLAGFRLQTALPTGWTNVFTFPTNTALESGDFMVIGNGTNGDFQANLYLPNSSFTPPGVFGIRLVAPSSSVFVADALMYGLTNEYGFSLGGFGEELPIIRPQTNMVIRRTWVGYDSDRAGNWKNVDASAWPPHRQGATNSLDLDGDGLSNTEEIAGGVFPIGEGSRIDDTDTDNDGLTDAEEAEYGTNPTDVDTDGDAFPWSTSVPPRGNDADELASGTDPLDPDSETSEDGIPDGWELEGGLNPLSPDSDNDAIPDSDEHSDVDGIPNAEEVANLTNPFLAADVDPRSYIWTKDGKDIGGGINEGDIGHDASITYEIIAKSDCPPIMVHVVEGGYTVEVFSVSCGASLIWLNPEDAPPTNRYYCIDPTNTNFSFVIQDGGTTWPYETEPQYGADISLEHGPTSIDLDAGEPEYSEENTGIIIADRISHPLALRRKLTFSGPDGCGEYLTHVTLTYDTEWLRVYDSEEDGNIIASDTSFPVDAPLPDMYLEGIAPSESMRDAQIKIAGDEIPVSDCVNVTVLQAHIGSVAPMADCTLHPGASRKPLALPQTLPDDWNGLMELSVTGAEAYWTPTGGTPIVLGETVFTNLLLPQTVYLGDGTCGEGEAKFSVVGLEGCWTNTPIPVFGINATLDGVAESDEESSGGFIADHTTHTNAPRTLLTLEACGPAAATGSVSLSWNSSLVEIYTSPIGGTALTSLSTPFDEFNGTNLYVQGIAPGTNTISWSYSEQPECVDVINVTVLKIDMVTPAGDPVNSAVDGGDGSGSVPDGANEFTFSPASPGVLTLKLKAQVTPSGVASLITDKVHFTVDAISGSTMAWATANPGGKPTASGDYLLATVTFTGLPAANTSFGSKLVAVYCDSSKQDEEPYEVFFPKSEKNHPGPDSGTTPNWFYYWNQSLGNLANIAYGGNGLTKAGEVKGMTDWSYLAAQDKVTRFLYDGAADKAQWINPNFGPWTGIDAFYNVYLHESKHVWQISTYDNDVPVAAGTPWQYGWSWNQGLANHNHETLGADGLPGNPNADDDGDGITNNLITTGRGELGYGGDDVRKCDSGWDTWPLSQGTMPSPPWAQNTPNEHKAYEAMSNAENTQAAKDWGDPGKQHATLNKHDD